MIEVSLTQFLSFPLQYLGLHIEHSGAQLSATRVAGAAMLFLLEKDME